jgi:hypothetical protein
MIAAWLVSAAADGPTETPRPVRPPNLVFIPARRGLDEASVSLGAHFNFKTQPAVEVPPGVYLADWLTDKAVDFMRRHRDRPLVLDLPHFATHSPYQAKPELVARFSAKPDVGGDNNPTYAAME